MTRSPEIANLAKALVKFQKEVKPVKKEANNPFFNSKYADLSSIIETIKEPLAKQGLAYTQFPIGEFGVTTILMHESGEWIEETFSLRPVDLKPQSVGSAITYARRYALGAILGIATEEDDDGNKASGPVTSAKRNYPTTTASGKKVWNNAKTPEQYGGPDGKVDEDGFLTVD